MESLKLVAKVPFVLKWEPKEPDLILQDGGMEKMLFMP